MMSNIIKKLNKLVVFIPLILITVFGCSEDRKDYNYIDVTFKDSTKLEVKNFKFYIGENEALFLYISDLALKEKLKSKPLKEVSIIIDDSIYHSTIIKEFYSRKIINTKYYLQVNNQTNKIVSDLINGKEMFFVGWSSDIKIPKELLINDNPH